jgi:uncharacterized membrane protein
MKFKLKAWMVYLLGFPVVFSIGYVTLGDLNAYSLLGEYLLWGTVGLGAYYIGIRLWFGKQKNQSK